MGGERARVRAARSVGGAVGVARAASASRAWSPSKKTSSTSSRWPPVTTTACGPRRVELRGRAPRRRRSASPASTRASGRFGVITVARGSRSSSSAARAPSSSSDGAGLGDHHRVDHDRDARVEQVERRRRRRRPSPRCRACRSSPRRRRCPSATCADLLDDELGRDGLDRADADGVLRGQRRDRRHPVDAAARERLQVGLDAGAAAGVGAGDREDGGDAVASWRVEARGQVRHAHVPPPELPPHQPEQLELGQRARGRLRPPPSCARARRRVPCPRSTCVEQARAGRARAAGAAPSGTRRRVGAEQEVERVAGVADHARRRRGAARWCPRTRGS